MFFKSCGWFPNEYILELRKYSKSTVWTKNPQNLLKHGIHGRKQTKGILGGEELNLMFSKKLYVWPLWEKMLMRPDPNPSGFFLRGWHAWSKQSLKWSPDHSSFRLQVTCICIFNTRTFLFPLLRLLIYNCSIWKKKKKHFSFASWPSGFSETASENMAVWGLWECPSGVARPPPPCGWGSAVGPLALHKATQCGRGMGWSEAVSV